MLTLCSVANPARINLTVAETRDGQKYVQCSCSAYAQLTLAVLSSCLSSLVAGAMRVMSLSLGMSFACLLHMLSLHSVELVLLVVF